MYNNNLPGNIIMRRSSEFVTFAPARYVEVVFLYLIKMSYLFLNELNNSVSWTFAASEHVYN